MAPQKGPMSSKNLKKKKKNINNGSSPLGVAFFAAVKHFDANFTISGNFVLIANNSIVYYNILGKLDYVTKRKKNIISLHINQMDITAFQSLPLLFVTLNPSLFAAPEIGRYVSMLMQSLADS